MRLRFLLIPLTLIALSFAFIACSGDDDDDGGDDSGGQPTQTAAPDNNDAGDDDDDASGDDDDDGNGGGFGTGTGTLTIGNESWEVTGIGCVFSAEEARNPDFPFNLSGFTQSSTGARAQVSADIYDPSGQERTEGEGVSHNISIDDIEDFENPSVSWSTIGALPLDDEAIETVITIDGKTIHGEGSFDDGTTDDFESVMGTLDVQCP